MIERAAVTTTYSASAITVLAGLTINEWVALGGLLIGLAGLAINWWFKKEHLKLVRRRDHDEDES